MQYRFIQNHQSEFRVDEMCECLELSRSGYYSWNRRAPSDRSVQDAVIKERIGELHRQARVATVIARFIVILKTKTCAVDVTGHCV